MVRQAQKEGQAKAASPEVARVASSIKKSDAKDFASTKHKGLPEKKKMNEEGYDHYRDNILMKGGDHRSKETKNRSYTPSKPVKGKTAAQKAAKGKSALDIVKANIRKQYGKGAIMGEDVNCDDRKAMAAQHKAVHNKKKDETGGMPATVTAKNRRGQMQGVDEGKQETGRSNYGKASVRNMRRLGKGGNRDDSAERLVGINKREAEHKASRGVKGSTQKREDKMKPVKWSDKNNNDNRTEEFTAEAMDSGSGVGYEPGKPAAKLGAIKLISKKEADAARERILAKTKAKREAAKKKMSEGMYDIDPKTGKSPVASSVEKGNKKKGEKRLKHFAKLAKKMVGEGTVAKDMCKKNCGCGQDPCITYGEQTQKPAAARPADKVMVSELSKKTYGSYVKKAATEIGTSAMKGDYKKMQKRHKGVLDASDKLQKEELKMTKKEYSKIHKDFKSDDPKKPRTTKYVPGKGTVSMPVKFVDEAVYTGPNKEDRKQIKKMDNPSYAKKLADYEKNMDPKKRQALKDKATKGMKFTVEAMSSYDRNRKAAAKRAAARNAERRAGKRGGRMEGETYRTEAGVHMHHKGYKAEGMSYGLYKGSGKPSGPMAAFGKKNKLNKPETKKKKVQSFKKFKAGQEPASASAPDMSEATLATARKNIGRDPKKKSCWKGYKATGTKMKDGRAVPDCKPA